MPSSDAAPENSEPGGTPPQPGAELAWTMLEGLSTPLCLRDQKSRYVWANAAFQSAFGRARLELIGKTDFDLLPPEQALLEQMRDARVFREGAPPRITSVSGHQIRRITNMSVVICMMRRAFVLDSGTPLIFDHQKYPVTMTLKNTAK